MRWLWKHPTEASKENMPCFLPSPTILPVHHVRGILLCHLAAGASQTALVSD
jgi:hypothetical protein